MNRCRVFDLPTRHVSNNQFIHSIWMFIKSSAAAFSVQCRLFNYCTTIISLALFFFFVSLSRYLFFASRFAFIPFNVIFIIVYILCAVSRSVCKAFCFQFHYILQQKIHLPSEKNTKMMLNFKRNRWTSKLTNQTETTTNVNERLTATATTALLYLHTLDICEILLTEIRWFTLQKYV